MNDHFRTASSIALAALMSLGNQAPPEARDVSSRLAAAGGVEERSTDAAGAVTDQPWNAVVRGGRTGMGPAARSATSDSLPSGSARQKDEGDRTGSGPKAVGTPAGGCGHFADVLHRVQETRSTTPIAAAIACALSLITGAKEPDPAIRPDH